MLFSSMIFLWLFLPLVFIGYRLAPKKFKNLFLLLASVLFYAWGEPKNIFLIFSMAIVNWCTGLWIARLSVYTDNRRQCLPAIIGTVTFDFLLLGYFKYFNFIVDTIRQIFSIQGISARQIMLPIGISFFTFQTVSYIIDLYRGEISVQKNFIHFFLYISFFPQLIAGPIVKYRDIQQQIDIRILSVGKTAYGIKRFIYGLSKKVLLANSFGQVSERIFLDTNIYNESVLIFGAILYALQIYYDFSGYSDMAIGLGKMFGFDFMENFHYPYMATSITDFWRRWHISLSTWFKEYLYIPLGGNRKGAKRTYINLLIVFFCTGFWHGASFNFIFWGMYHGFFLIIERVWLKKLLDACGGWKAIVPHLYTVTVVFSGWILFNADSLRSALHYYRSLLLPHFRGPISLGEICTPELCFLFIVGVMFCGVLQSVFPKYKNLLYCETQIYLTETLMQMVLLGICIVTLVSSTYNPFIYFRF